MSYITANDHLFYVIFSNTQQIKTRIIFCDLLLDLVELEILCYYKVEKIITKEGIMMKKFGSLAASNYGEEALQARTVRPALSKDEAELKLSAVNIVLKSMEDLFGLLDTYAEPAPMERENTVEDDEFEEAASVLPEMDKFIRKTFAQIDDVYWQTNAKAIKAAERYVVMCHANNYLLKTEKDVI